MTKRENPKMTARLTRGIKWPSIEFEKATSGVGRGNSSIASKSLVSHKLSWRPPVEMPSR